MARLKVNTGPLARYDDSPAFEEPWQAQALALAFNLIDQGAFTNVQWSEMLGAKLVEANDRGEPDTTETYYQCVLAALEALLASTDGLPAAELDERTEAWRRAYLRTPHGHPVELEE